MSAAVSVPVTVTVQENPAITTTVGADGTFTLRGLPEGSFHLVFSSGGTTLGTLAFSEVKPNQEITLTVELSGSTIVVIEERRNGIGHGDVTVGHQVHVKGVWLPQDATGQPVLAQEIKLQGDADDDGPDADKTCMIRWTRRAPASNAMASSQVKVQK